MTRRGAVESIATKIGTAETLRRWVRQHLKTPVGYFDHVLPSSESFNLRMDPVEQRHGLRADDMAMQFEVAWGGARCWRRCRSASIRW